MGVAAMDFAKWGLGVPPIEGTLVFSLKIIVPMNFNRLACISFEISSETV